MLLLRTVLENNRLVTLVYNVGMVNLRKYKFLALSLIVSAIGWTITLTILTWISEYLNRINSYRQRVWTCRVTGKTNLTYEEALVSEKRATEKVQQFPTEVVVPALRIIQYSKCKLDTFTF